MFNGKLAAIPHFVYTDHTTMTNLFYPDINPTEYIRSGSFIKKCEMKIYQDAMMIFTFGSLVKNSLVQQYNIPNEKVLPVYSGSNVKFDILQNESKYNSKNILFVGVDWKRKGGPILIEIFKNVLLKHPDASLTIVGCTPKQIDSPNCKIIGKIPLEEVAEYYNSSSVFCLPTLREPFGVAFVEAMSYRLPIIANNIGCIPDLVINDYNGYLINNDITEYSNTICNLLDNPLKCRELGNNGYELARTKFNWKKVGSNIKENIEGKLTNSSRFK
jgi:glycosyltransferase involved in cell wall biosynthesis